MKAAREAQERMDIYERTCNAEAYHLNRAKKTGYWTAEALQFILGEEAVKGALKLGKQVSRGGKVLIEIKNSKLGREATQLIERYGGKVVEKGTRGIGVWADIVVTQENHLGSVLPKSFKLKKGDVFYYALASF